MRGRIVAADADQATTRLLQVILEQAGYDVAATTDGAEAASAIEAGPPDAVLVGTSLPHVDGIEIISRLKKSERTRAIPVIVLLSSNLDQGLFRVWKAGADVVLTKPFSPGELLSVVEKAIQDPHGDGPRPAGGAMHGNLWVDVA